VLVGDSAKARKGSSWDHVRRLLDHADPTLAARTLTGLSSGEGLIWAVRDATGNDPGVTDRRVLVVDPSTTSPQHGETTFWHPSGMRPATRRGTVDIWASLQASLYGRSTSQS
jgi:hypothetical protein